MRTHGRVVFIGAVHEARPALESLLASDLVEVAAVVTSTPDGAARRSGAINLAGLAAARGVPVLRTDDANDPRVVESVRALAPDLLVVVGWNQLIKPDLLAVPNRGCIGFHASMLPRHRGHAPVNWAILRGETSTGNTMMLLDPGADTGDIVDQVPIPIGPTDTCASVYREVGRAGARLLIKHLPGLLDGTAPRRPQRRDEGNLLPRRTPDMGIVDWNRPAREVYDWIRALTDPYPGAFTLLDGRRVLIWAACLPARDEGRQMGGRPGEILDVGADGVRVAVADGSVLITSMSSAGRRPEPAARWVRTHSAGIGTAFDPVPAEVADWARRGGRRPEVVT
ncbi:MAG TPA: methionyl-tRNA formyltransferase [Jatrophihabitans sp.]|nr:methionyl-tRNA formyltransferase [Jatrophihabitans sp.]